MLSWPGYLAHQHGPPESTFFMENVTSVTFLQLSLALQRCDDQLVLTAMASFPVISV